MLESPLQLFQGTMKLMGAPKLFAAVADASLVARGACAALCAELEDGDWTCADDVISSFPRAGWFEGRIVISVHDALDAVVAFNFEKGIALIDTAEPNATATAAARAIRRRP